MKLKKIICESDVLFTLEAVLRWYQDCLSKSKGRAAYRGGGCKKAFIMPADENRVNVGRNFSSSLS